MRLRSAALLDPFCPGTAGARPAALLSPTHARHICLTPTAFGQSRGYDPMPAMRWTLEPLAGRQPRPTASERRNSHHSPPVLNKLLFRSALHEHADPAQRILGLAALPPDSLEIAQLLSGDPTPEVRAAAAAHCADPTALAAAWQAESAPDVRTAIAASLERALAATPDDAAVEPLLAAENCSDAFRAAVALHTQDEDRCRRAIEGMRDDEALVDLALAAAHAPVRLAAAERVHAPQALQRLADAAKDKDRGVARLARQRLEAIERRASQSVQADALLAQAEALVAQPGPIVMAAVELERRWKALDLADDAGRRARWDAAGRLLQERFDREHEAQRARARFEQRLGEWLAALQATPAAERLSALRDELLALREQAQEHDDAPALARLQQAERQIAHWEQLLPALAAAEALVIEAEQLAAGTPIDNAQLPARWQALELSVRTPDLTRRFEAALLVIEQRRLAHVRATQQQETAARHQLHELLHTAEQALAAGHLQEARAAADQTRPLKAAAGTLPKPTVQRLSRLVQQLVELERWHSFGQHTARVQLCERAEASEKQDPAPTPAQAARDVQALRTEWKALDEQHAGVSKAVPRSLWERFDGACERAYAPAARHFSELAAQRKAARKQREDFIAAAAAHGPTLLTDPPDWRVIEHWLRDTDKAWHGGDLGSVDPGTWKKLDARLKAAVAPLRDVLSTARNVAKAEREALVAEAQALAAKAAERDTPSLVRAIQARWQEHAKRMPLAQREERALWEQFRAACDVVFETRHSKRKETDQRKHQDRRALETLCEQLEQLAHSTEPDDAAIRRAEREVQEQWRKSLAESGAAPAPLDARFRKARAAVDALLGTRARGREAAVWQALLVKERLCEQLDALASADPDAARETAAADSVRQRWAALAPLPTAWEQKILARRDAALHALSDEDARYDYADRIEDSGTLRRDALLELELLLGMPSPADLQKERLAVQVRQIRSRLKTAQSANATAGDHLLAWCITPGVADARDRERCERIVSSLEHRG